MKTFASAIGCSIRTDRADVVATLQELKVKPADGELVTVSCRTRDIMDRQCRIRDTTLSPVALLALSLAQKQVQAFNPAIL